MDNREFSGSVSLVIEAITNYHCVTEHVNITHSSDGVSLLVKWRVKLGSRDSAVGETSDGIKREEDVLWFIPYCFPQKPLQPLLRSSFPRESHPHIYPSLSHEPVRPCISDIKLLALLAVGGVNAVLVHLETWLDRAANSSLMNEEQGWEPMLFTNIKGSLLDCTGGIREWINSNAGKTSIFFGRSLCRCTSNSKNISFVSAMQLTGDYQPNLIGSRVEAATFQAQLPNLLVLIPESERTKKFQHLPVTNRKELRELVQKLLVDSMSEGKLILPDAPDFFLESERIVRDSVDRENEPKVPGFVVTLIIPRPFHIIGSTCRYEIRPFFIRIHKEAGDDTEAFALDFLTATNREDISRISFKSPRIDYRIAMLGSGSLGSKIALSLAKSGDCYFDFYDNRLLRPHNNARYGMLIPPHFIGMPKSLVLANCLKDALNIETNYHFLDITSINAEEFGAVDVILDTTASSEVFFHLSYFAGMLPAPLVKVSLYGRSSLGFLGLESSDNSRQVRIDDLEALLYTQSIYDIEVRSSLFFKQGPERQIVNVGCDSHTTIMPDTLVNLAAAAITSKLDTVVRNRARDEEGQLYLCKLDEATGDISWWSQSLEKTIVFERKEHFDWEVRVLSNAYMKIDRLSREYFPSEYGSPIVGRICELTRTIYVTDILIHPDHSSYSLSHASLPLDGVIAQDIEVREKTQHNIYVLGTWHSHNSLPKRSNKDLETFKSLKSQMNTAVPVMLLWYKGELQVIDGV